MRLKCPSCNAEMDLDVLLAHEEGRHVLAQLVTLGVPLGALLLRYVGLFRPPKRALAMSRTLALLAEVVPDIQRGAIHRKGRDWATTPAMWQQAIEQVLAVRDKGTLTLPLASHGYLYEVLLGQADKAEAVAEREREASQRSRAHAGGPAPAFAGWTATAPEALGTTFGPIPPLQIAPPRDAGPSRYSQRLKAEIEARKRPAASAETNPTEDPQ